MKYTTYLLILIVITGLFFLSACSSKAPDNLGLQDGHLTPCPESPNCVSSEALDEEHRIAPIAAHGSKDKLMVDLAKSIESMYGAKIIQINDLYLHAQFTSRVLRFVDDLECYYNEEKGFIQIRSASRVGYSDLGVNRKRVEELRAIFTKTQ